MADAGIIRPSNSPWCAPAVYVPKANDEVRICVDFVQLNKVTKKDLYPVPRADGPQQKLANKKVFSKIDLKSAYWQFPMHKDSVEKTAFSPGPGYGLWEFTVMPYGLTGATQTCQRGLDEVLRDCKDCVDNYVDDCIIFSDHYYYHIDIRNTYTYTHTKSNTKQAIIHIDLVNRYTAGFVCYHLCCACCLTTCSQL